LRKKRERGEKQTRYEGEHGKTGTTKRTNCILKMLLEAGSTADVREEHAD
jgi:hypothetical protein